MEKTEELSLDIRDIQERIYIIRGEKVMLDKDLAVLYGVPTKRLNESVRRNLSRFPDDFVFKLNHGQDGDFLRSQFATLKPGMHLKYTPFAFTEQGIAMLSSVLNSDRAISVNIQIIRIFTKLRKMIDEYKELRQKIEALERNTEENTTDIQEVFRIVNLILIQEEEPKEKIGFNTGK